MSDFSFVLLYVDKPEASAAFYAGLLGKPIVSSSPNFAILPLRDGVMLGLWAAPDVKPEVTAPPGGAEIAFSVADANAVRTLHEEWIMRGLTILQTPTKMSFGLTFTALDPDGHRIRVFAPDQA